MIKRQILSRKNSLTEQKNSKKEGEAAVLCLPFEILQRIRILKYQFKSQWSIYFKIETKWFKTN